MPGLPDFFDYGFFFFLLAGQQQVRMIHADDGAVRRNHLYLQTINGAELLLLCGRGAGHAAHIGVERDQVFQRNGAQNPALFF